MIKTLKILAVVSLGLILFIWIANTAIVLSAKSAIYQDLAKIPPVEAVLVPGASVYRSGQLSPILKYRVEKALHFSLSRDTLPLIFSGFSISGGYNEPQAMREFALKRGIPENVVLMDEKGSSTLSTLVNLKKQNRFANVLIVSQEFHLPRALMISRNLSLNCYGLIAPGRPTSAASGSDFREIFSRIKDFFLIKFFKLFTSGAEAN